MAQVVVIEKSVLDNILSELRELKQRLFSVEKTVGMKKKKLTYGSEEWWEESIKQSRKDYKNGDYTTYDNVSNLIHDLQKGL